MHNLIPLRSSEMGVIYLSFNFRFLCKDSESLTRFQLFLERILADCTKPMAGCMK